MNFNKKQLKPNQIVFILATTYSNRIEIIETKIVDIEETYSNGVLISVRFSLEETSESSGHRNKIIAFLSEDYIYLKEGDIIRSFIENGFAVKA